MATDCETYRIILVGSSGAGKSAILTQYVDNMFDAQFAVATVGVDARVKIVNYNDRRIKLSIMDTAGQERFRSITPSFYRNADGVVLVYDVSDRTTFAEIQSNLDDCISFCYKEQFAKILVANKMDCQNHHVTFIEGQDFARENDMMFIATSAARNEHIEEIFLMLVEKIFQTPSLVKHRPAENHPVSNAAGYRDGEDCNITHNNQITNTGLSGRRGQIGGNHDPSNRTIVLGRTNIGGNNNRKSFVSLLKRWCVLL